VETAEEVSGPEEILAFACCHQAPWAASSLRKADAVYEENHPTAPRGLSRPWPHDISVAFADVTEQISLVQLSAQLDGVHARIAAAIHLPRVPVGIICAS
jgi:hypothetical protein